MSITIEHLDLALDFVTGKTASFCVAGGAVRDILLEREVRDVDVYVGPDFLDKWEDEEDWVIAPLISDYGWYHNIELVRDVSVDGVPVPVQIVVLRSFMTPEKVFNSFDFGICRVAYDGRNVFVSRDFAKDVENETLTFFPVHDWPVPAVAERLKKLKAKFPDFTPVNVPTDVLGYAGI